MGRRAPIPDETRAEVVRLHGEGLGCNAIARRLKIGVASVSRIAREAGLTFDRSATDLATRARTIDLAATRTLLLQKMAVASSDMLDDLEGPYLVYSFGGRDNTYREHLLDSPPVEVRRSVITTAAQTTDRIARYLDAHGDAGARAEVESMIDRLAAAMEAEVFDDAEFDTSPYEPAESDRETDGH